MTTNNEPADTLPGAEIDRIAAALKQAAAPHPIHRDQSGKPYYTLTPPTSQQPSAPESESPPVHPCADCGAVGDWPLLINTTCSGYTMRLCPDCRDENDPDDVMQEPCCHCGGSGREWEGWACDYCDGTGTDAF